MVEETPEQQRRLATPKEEILNRIRTALAGRQSDRESEYAYIQRQYNTAGSLDENAKLELFMDRLQDYGAAVYECSEIQISAAISSALKERQLRKMVTSRDFPTAWIPAGFDFSTDHRFDYDDIDKFEGVVTPCAIAIAETGTIVLRHAGEEPRRALTLIPDYHLCVVFAIQVVNTVSEGIRQMAAMGNVPLTTISGPSATADIEMTRIQGVHGPRTLDVILVR
jgi:L-lactate dehydrogenase complex protein LldG